MRTDLCLILGKAASHRALECRLMTRSGHRSVASPHLSADGYDGRRDWDRHLEADRMEVASLVLPVFAIIVTGWLAGWLGYISRSLADGLVHFAYNVAMPALLFVTI